MPLLRRRAPTYRRATDITGARLGNALLGYLAVVTLVVTLAPYDFAARPVHGLSWMVTPRDLLLNVVLFIPLGFVHQLTRPAGRRVQLLGALWRAALFSGAIETAQLFAPSRYTSLADVIMNVLGALLGALGYGLVVRRLDGPKAVRSLALELPLTGLVYLLIPLMWLIGLTSDGTDRDWLILPIASAAGTILGSVHGAVLEGQTQRPAKWLWVLCLVWFAIALLPGAVRDPLVLSASALALLATALWRRTVAGRVAGRPEHRRFELPTLRLVLPLFLLYLVTAALWPLTALEPQWHGLLLAFRITPNSQPAIFRPLEQLAAYSLLGYAVAEWYGRDFPRYRDLVQRVVLLSGATVITLELASGFLPSAPGSLTLALLCVIAAAVGGWLYGLQRDHVRALIVRRMTPNAILALAE